VRIVGIFFFGLHGRPIHPELRVAAFLRDHWPLDIVSVVSRKSRKWLPANAKLHVVGRPLVVPATTGFLQTAPIPVDGVALKQACGQYQQRNESTCSGIFIFHF
jgi:hypothetical protein